MLASRRMNSFDVEDIVQTTGERALKAPTALRTEKEFARWCSRVAQNLFNDEYARNKRARPAGEALRVESVTPEDIVVARAMLPFAEKLIDQLSDTERWAYTWQGPRPEDPKERNRFNVALHRAITRLERGYGALGAVLLGGIDSLRERLRDVSPSSAAAAGAAAAMAVSALLATDVMSRHEHHPNRPGGVSIVGGAQLIDEASVAKLTRRAREHALGRTASKITSGTGQKSPAFRAVVVPLPQYDGARHDVVIRPTEESDNGNVFCGGETMVTPYRCVKSPLPSVDEFLFRK